MGLPVSVPYSKATTGDVARGEITRMLRNFGCDRIGFMDLTKEHALVLEFEHHDRPVRLQVSAKGWAAMFLKAEPWNSRMRRTKAQYEADALEQGLIAVNSILRDWVKGQVTAVECGMMSFFEVFLPHMLTNDGRRFVEVAEQHFKALPKPEGGAS